MSRTQESRSEGVRGAKYHTQEGRCLTIRAITASESSFQRRNPRPKGSRAVVEETEDLGNSVGDSEEEDDEDWEKSERVAEIWSSAAERS